MEPALCLCLSSVILTTQYAPEHWHWNNLVLLCQQAVYSAIHLPFEICQSLVKYISLLVPILTCADILVVSIITQPEVWFYGYAC